MIFKLIFYSDWKHSFSGIKRFKVYTLAFEHWMAKFPNWVLKKEAFFAQNTLRMMISRKGKNNCNDDGLKLYLLPRKTTKIYSNLFSCFSIRLKSQFRDNLSIVANQMICNNEHNALQCTKSNLTFLKPIKHIQLWDVQIDLRGRL